MDNQYPIMNLTFDEIMALELKYAQAEYHAVREHDYSAADVFHGMRWKCMDAAVNVAHTSSNAQH